MQRKSNITHNIPMLRRRTSSRLARNTEKQSKKQAIIFTVAIVVVLVVLVEFGPFFVNFFGNIVYTIRGGDKSDNNTIASKEIVQPPVLIGIPDATQSAYISFSGTSPDIKGVIEIYVNGDLKKEVDINDKTDFSVDSVVINTGSNAIKARFIKDKKTSAFTQDYNVTYIKDKPKLDVTSPSNNQTFTKADKKINITGTTDSDNNVTVNGFRAIVDSQGKFSYLLELNNGDNNISIEAVNPAGNTTKSDLKVIYNP